MKKRTLLGIFAILVVVAIILGVLLSTWIIDFITDPNFPFEIPEELLPGILLYTPLKVILSLVNMVLILLMLAIYVDLYRKLKSRFTAALLLMIIVLMFNVMTSNPAVFLRFGPQIVGFGPFLIIPDLFTTIALTVLFYISLE
jgi:hypothetical protein